METWSFMSGANVFMDARFSINFNLVFHLFFDMNLNFCSQFGVRKNSHPNGLGYYWMKKEP